MKKIILSCLILSFFVACNSSKKSEKSEREEVVSQEMEGAYDMHNAQNSLDYYGVYEGVTPCADCEGIKVTVKLNKDSTYSLTNVYLKDGKELNPSEFSGTYSWDETGFMITLDGVKDAPSRFFVGEGEIMIVDENGKKISSELSEHYELKQIETF